MPKSTRPAPKSAASRSTTARTPGARTSQVASAPSQPKSPDVPRGFRAPTGTQVRQYKKLSATQLDEAPAAIAELNRAASYADDFGKRAPDRETLASQLDAAVTWGAEFARAEAWARYVRAQSEIWNDAAARTLERLAPTFRTALEDEPALARRYASTGAMLGAHRASAKRGVATRRAKERAAKKGT